jgi:hypothetical protein
MQVNLNSDDKVHGGESLAAWARRETLDKLGRFADQVTRLDVHLGDASAAHGQVVDKRCTLEARGGGRATHTAAIRSAAASLSAPRTAGHRPGGRRAVSCMSESTPWGLGPGTAATAQGARGCPRCHTTMATLGLPSHRPLPELEEPVIDCRTCCPCARDRARSTGRVACAESNAPIRTRNSRPLGRAASTRAWLPLWPPTLLAVARRAVRLAASPEPGSGLGPADDGGPTDPAQARTAVAAAGPGSVDPRC